jgi:flagellar biosynthetic protein FlhB
MPGEKHDKTEQPTPRRKQKARRQGQVVKSNELKSALMILSGAVALKLIGPFMKTEILERLTLSFSQIADVTVSAESTPGIMMSWTMWSGRLLAPMLLGLTALGVGVTALIQGGVVFSTGKLRLNFGRLNPVTGAGQLVSGRVLFNLFRDVVKVALIGFVCYRVVTQAIRLLLDMPDVAVGQVLSNAGGLVISLCLKAGLVLFVLGLLDYAYQKRSYIKDLKMSKRDLKDEHKESEGDPLVKSRIRSVQRDLSRRRMMQAVPEADVVLTNPTEIAVALKYDPETMDAPTVVAKGQRLIAETIKSIAEKFQVPVIEDRFLARSLFKNASVGDEIPVDLYRAVAEVLSYVYRMKGKLSPLETKGR